MLNQSLEQAGLNVAVFISGQKESFRNVDFLQDGDIVEQTGDLEFGALAHQMQSRHADIVLSCVGVTNRQPEFNGHLWAISANSMFPHKLTDLSRRKGLE